jgi:hypothetical protein
MPATHFLKGFEIHITGFGLGGREVKGGESEVPENRLPLVSHFIENLLLFLLHLGHTLHSLE